MMEKKLDAKEARVQIWEELLRVAKPDSKFSWQFSEFICDYEGSEKGTALLTDILPSTFLHCQPCR